MDWISDPTAWSALTALLSLEIALGVDNVIFISILTAKLPAGEQEKARKIGLLAAGGMRVLLLLSVRVGNLQGHDGGATADLQTFKVLISATPQPPLLLQSCSRPSHSVRVAPTGRRRHVWGP